MDEATRELLGEVRRDVDDAAHQIGQAVERVESGETVSSESLLGEAVTRLRLLSQRIEQHLGSTD